MQLPPKNPYLLCLWALLSGAAFVLFLPLVGFVLFAVEGWKCASTSVRGHMTYYNEKSPRHRLG
jgi:hypothetical protein